MQKYRNSFKKEGFITFFSSFLMFYVSFSYQISILPIRVPFAFTSNQTSTPPWAGNLRKHRAALQIYRLYRISINNKRKPIQRLPFIKLAEREVCEQTSATPCIVTFYAFQTFLCSRIVATREYLERTHRYRY